MIKYYIIILLLLLYNKIYVIPSDIPSSSLPMGWTSHIHEGKAYVSFIYFLFYINIYYY